MTVDEIEAACDAGYPPDFLRHDQQTGDLEFKALFHPCGFPTEVRTNRVEVLELAAELWSQFTQCNLAQPERGDDLRRRIQP